MLEILAILCIALGFASVSGLRYLEGSPTGQTYVSIPDLMNRSDAERACQGIGAHLANLLSDDDFVWVTSKLEGSAWIGSFNHQTMDGACLAAHPGGAVYVPKARIEGQSACENLMSILCEFN